MNIGISNFAAGRHVKGKGSYFEGTTEELLQLVKTHWDKRKPGAGRDDLSKVVLVPVPVDRFVGSTVKLRRDLVLKADVEQRQDGEDLYIKVRAVDTYQLFGGTESQLHSPRNIERKGPYEGVKPDAATFVNIVCYHKDALLENKGKRSGDYEWEIVSINVSDVDDEPMHPLAMARNYLEMPGGTFAPYTAKQFADAIYYWSQRIGTD